MPFGLTNAPATFQAAMTTKFCNLLDHTVLIYLNDILVYSRTLNEHLEHLRAVLERLRMAHYKANRDMCEFALQELEYLGHYVMPHGIRPFADKIQVIQDWSDLKCTTDVRSFLGLASYYMRFVKGFQCIGAPLSRLQSPLVPFEFNNEARHAFHTLKTALLQAPVLSIHDVPEDIVTDRDTRFMSTFWTTVMVELSSAPHLQTNMQMERAHQAAQMMLRTLIRPDQKDWVDRLLDIEFAYNTSVHPAIGVTPFKLHHGGRKGRIFADILLSPAADIDATCSPTSTRKYRELLGKARTNMQKAQVAFEKCQFFLTTISFLGHVVTDQGLQPEPQKVAAVRDTAVPTTVTPVHDFLGLASYYRRFIKGFAAIAGPLTNLQRKDQLLILTPECDQAFSKLKAALISAPVLIRPDPEKPFILITDWQSEAISAILAQVAPSGLESVVEYASKSVSAGKRNYAAPTGECYVALWGISHFRAYLHGRKFTLVTDQEPLLALKKSKDYSGMIGQWATVLQSMDFDICHRKHERHGNGDGLTRLHRPEKVPKSEEVVPWNEPKQEIGPRYGQVEILSKQYDWIRSAYEEQAAHFAVTWTQTSEHPTWIENLELLIIQAWRTNVEGDLLGFLFGSVRPGRRQFIVQELIAPIVQLADDLLPDIIWQSDDSPALHVLTRTLDSYLQWSACLEEPWDEDSLPSRQEYLKPYSIIDPAFYPKAEEVVIDDEEEDDDEETSKEGSYSEDSEGE
ncbi:hypothetical protein CBR_g11046 [Chara braunii]|uniref:Reverse transcriptase domain-containing protein n=1 Tax=Chara braunii TaxID=69332 RepID=A0A388KQA6_CHABU|nr:hypothetical protein CBR_g11046 [Chara braunii]|eukprot:GBG72113.1 hypothetical protein CBR_g11046 [Chara braunii]